MLSIIRSNGHGSRSRRRAGAAAAPLIALLSAAAAAQTAPAMRHGSVERVRVHGASLQGNLEGDSPDREVSVYLPPGYRRHWLRRYPVLYLLHGFTDTDLRWFGSAHLFDGAAAADRAFSGGVPELIVVMPNAMTRYFGSLYSSGPTTGDWESFITRDLVSYIDRHYRTIAERNSRGIAGHSAGGYGAIRIGMKHPDVFSSVYAMSACCLLPVDLQDPARGKLPELQSDAQLGAADFFTKAMYASAAAWSPDPRNPPRYLDLPWQGGAFQPQVAAKWAANAPLVMLDQYVSNLRTLQAIGLDVGTRDSLLPGSQALDEALSAYGIGHGYETYDGDHLNRIEERFETRVLPFFARNLRFR